MRAEIILATCLVVTSATLANKASAGGVEYPGAGAQGLGRAGAVVAKSDDPMVLANNPAGLAELRGNQLLLDLNIALMRACVDPIGYYGWGAYGGGSPSRIPDPAGGEPLVLNLGTANAETAAYYDGPLDTVCMKQNVVPVPQVGFTSRVTEKLGVGFGLMFPAVMPQGRWGEENGVVRGSAGLRPAATRYMLLNSGTIGVFPTAGVGLRLLDWLRLGASFEWGVINVDDTSMAAVSGGTSPSGDIVARLRATDWFIPALNASVHIVPTDSIDIVGMFRYQDDLNAAGHLDLTTGIFDVRARPRTRRNIVVEGVRQKFPIKLLGAIRYAYRLAPRPSGTGQDETKGANRSEVRDPFLNELWDVEANFEYLMSDRHVDTVIDYRENQTLEFETANGMVMPGPFPEALRMGDKTDQVIGRHWKNQIAVRVGGSYNVVPGVFGISFGGHYESRGVDPSYMQIGDYWPVQRIGLHAGVRFRVSSKIDVVASYAHIFQETIVTGAPDHELGATIYTRFAETGVIDTIDKGVGVAGRGEELPPKLENPPAQAVDGKARVLQRGTRSNAGRPLWIVNSGTYRSGLDVLAVGVNVHY